MRPSRGRKRGASRESRGAKLRKRKKDLDEIRMMVEKGGCEPLENPRQAKCLECDRVLEGKDMPRHLKSRGHRRRLKDLREDALLAEDRKQGLF
jgi:hypothetical protein